MSALKTLWAWILSGLRPHQGPSDQDIARALDKAINPELVDAAEGFEQLAQSTEAQRELAQDQDHGDSRARPPKPDAQSKSGERDPIKILLGPRVDTAAWTIKPPRPGKWPPIYTELIAALGRGAKTVELTDLQGEVVTFAISWGKAGLVIQHGYTRIEISKRRAEVQITALASEVEGVRSWYLRAMPRAVWWLMGEDVEDDIAPRGNRATGYDDEVRDLREAIKIELLDGLAPRLEQRRIDQCCDAQGGLELGPGIEQTVVSRLKAMAIVPKPGEVEGLLIGMTGINPMSFAIYAKPEEQAAKRGPEHGALIERWRAAGMVDGQPLTRYELRNWGRALVLEGLDARRPSAALDEELLGKLWAHGLTQVRLVDPRHPASRMRDKAEHPAWTALRDAGGHTGPLRLTRVTAQAQLSSTVAHARDRLAQAGADVEQLLVDEYDGTHEGDIALRELGEAIGHKAEWAERRAKAAARYEALLESVREAGQP